MKIQHLQNPSDAHEFAMFDNEEEQFRFRAAPDFYANGHIEAYSGKCWPGEYPHLFESPPASEAADLNPLRVRLTARGIAECYQSMRKECQCEMCHPKILVVQ